jgi:phenylacetate-CoA ligase
MTSLWRLLRRLRWSLYLARQLIGQARYPFSPAARIRRDADRRARRMVAYAYRWVPYYRETLDRLGLTPADFRSADDLRKLPLISVTDLQVDPERLRSRQFAPQELHMHRSSGSTGHPHEVWHELAAIYASVAHGERETSIHRRIIGKGRRLVAMGLKSPINLDSVRDLTRANALYPSRRNMWRGLRGSQARVDDPPEAILAALDARQPDLLYAYGSTMALVFPYAQRHGLAFHRPTVARYASDGLPATVRALLTDVYGIQVFSAYQSIEAFKMGFECEAHRGYHVNADLYPLRIVDEQGADCPAGVVGEIVVSNLVNRGTVLLNYRMGDRAAWLADPCPCARALPMLSFIQGRVTDAVYAPDGRRVDYTAFITPMLGRPAIYEYQVTQHALDHISIALQLAPGADEAALERELRAALQPVFGAEMRLTFRFNQELRRTGAAKLRYVVSEIAPSG